MFTPSAAYFDAAWDVVKRAVFRIVIMAVRNCVGAEQSVVCLRAGGIAGPTVFLT